MLNIIEVLTPRVPKRVLLFIAAAAWTIAGGILLTRGIGMVIAKPVNAFYTIGGSAIGGVAFFILLFSRISRKHINRILLMPIERPCAFSFFNLKSYLMMTIMISGGILLRLSGLVSPGILAVIYITMGIPLFLSAYRFYYNGIFYKVRN